MADLLRQVVIFFAMIHPCRMYRGRKMHQRCKAVWIELTQQQEHWQFRIQMHFIRNFSASLRATTNTDSGLIDLIAEAHAARQTVLEGKGSLAQIAARLGRCRGHLADRMRQSYLAPDIVTAILEGRQRVSLTRKKLLATPFSSDWEDQRRQLGFI
ncbi:hypothetical protein [Sphingosinicella xenopeptidilytica]|uniref:Uncharacterized protein n=1 Tax=Sphingosinicella xenopeptidilytica TaxID=364098 RepID=A0ABW3BZM9_SPHXN